MVDYSRSDCCRTSMFEYLICTRVAYRYDTRNLTEKFVGTRSLVEISERMVSVGGGKPAVNITYLTAHRKIALLQPTL